MPQLLSLLLVTLGMTLTTSQAPPANVPPATTFHSVVYFEVMTSNAARTSAQAAIKTYTSALKGQEGFIELDAFEQTGRPGHFSFIEAWRDQAAFDKRSAAIVKQFTDALEMIRVSDVDRRPYKVLTVANRSQTAGNTVFVVTHVDASPTPQLPAMLQKLAEDSRRDDGNLRFDIYQHTMRANHFTVIEAWRDRRALDGHASAPHTRQFRDAFGPLAGSPLDERVVEAVR